MEATPHALNGTASCPSSTRSDTSTETPSQADTPSTDSHSLCYAPAPALATSRYNRQLLVPQIGLTGQGRISRAKVLIVGLGGLGSPASLYLAGAGVHTLGLLDHDVVEQSNLHRQIAHRESSLGMTKVQSALRACRELNHEVNYVAHEVKIGGDNALSVIREYDVVLDCTDNPATRYLISDCCVVLGKTLVSGAAQKLEGQVMVLNWPMYGEGEEKVHSGRGPCYRCVFPHPPTPEMVKSCSEIGILGPVVGAVGTLMASETIRLIVEGGMVPRKSTMLLYSAWPSDPKGMFRVIGLRGRRKDCVTCGDENAITQKGLTQITDESIREGSIDYETWCGRVEEVRLLHDSARITAEDFFDKMRQPEKEQPTIVDVREAFEVELGPKVAGSINIPISRILRANNSVMVETKPMDELDTMLERAQTKSIYFICQRGNDSQIAAKKLLDRFTLQTSRNCDSHSPQQVWIGDVKGGFDALDKLALPG